MARKHWDYMKARKIAKQYTSKKLFRTQEPRCYAYATRHNFIQSLTAHMHDLREDKKWTLEALMEVSRPCSTSGEFKRHNYNAYAAALRQDLLEDLFPKNSPQHPADDFRSAA